MKTRERILEAAETLDQAASVVAPSSKMQTSNALSTIAHYLRWIVEDDSETKETATCNS